MLVEAHRLTHNLQRPHRSLSCATPAAFAVTSLVSSLAGCTYAKQERQCCAPSHSSWHKIRGQAKDRFLAQIRRVPCNLAQNKTASPVARTQYYSEAEGVRTLNLRIDSPNLLFVSSCRQAFLGSCDLC